MAAAEVGVRAGTLQVLVANGELQRRGDDEADEEQDDRDESPAAHRYSLAKKTSGSGRPFGQNRLTTTSRLSPHPV